MSQRERDRERGSETERERDRERGEWDRERFTWGRQRRPRWRKKRRTTTEGSRARAKEEGELSVSDLVSPHFKSLLMGLIRGRLDLDSAESTPIVSGLSRVGPELIKNRSPRPYHVAFSSRRPPSRIRLDRVISDSAEFLNPALFSSSCYALNDCEYLIILTDSEIQCSSLKHNSCCCTI